MEALLRQRKLTKGTATLYDPAVLLGRRKWQFYKHSVRARLSAAEIDELIFDELENTPDETLPLGFSGAADVERITYEVLELAGGLHYEPVPLVGASGDTYDMYMLSIEKLVSYVFGSVEYAASFDFEVKLDLRADDSEHIYSDVTTCRWYAKTVAEAPPNSRCLVLTFFSDGTVRSGPGTKYHGLMVTFDNLPLDMRHLAEHLYHIGTAPLVTKKMARTDRYEEDGWNLPYTLSRGVPRSRSRFGQAMYEVGLTHRPDTHTPLRIPSLGASWISQLLSARRG